MKIPLKYCIIVRIISHKQFLAFVWLLDNLKVLSQKIKKEIK